MAPLKILMVASEVAPLAKTGGLADMVSGLSSALSDLGHDVRIVFPRYPSVSSQAHRVESVHSLLVEDGGRVRSSTVERIWLRSAADASKPRPAFFAIRQDDYFGRRGIYQESGRDYPDNLARFAYFCRAVLDLVVVWQRKEGWVPDVLHAHDWQGGLIPIYLRSQYASRGFAATVRTVLTLHNVGYQGIFPAAQFPLLGLDANYFAPHGLEFYGSLNLLKGGILFADFLTTVSPTYCREIQTSEFGFGLEGVLGERRDRMVGIVNGIDTDTWNPETDPLLPANYSARNLDGKATCKNALQRECGFPAGGTPLLAVVSRLVSQKGIDLVVGATPSFLKDGAQLVVLGTGEAEVEADLRMLEQRHSDSVRVMINFDEGLAHRIQAGADMFLVPSRYEPCGLTQLCSLRYGTVPIVRRTGGLADTVVGFSDTDALVGNATGFVFDPPSSDALGTSVGLALSKFRDPEVWSSLMLAGMRREVGWAEPAKQYVDVYRGTIGRK